MILGFRIDKKQGGKVPRNLPIKNDMIRSKTSINKHRHTNNGVILKVLEEQIKKEGNLSGYMVVTTMRKKIFS